MELSKFEEQNILNVPDITDIPAEEAYKTLRTNIHFCSVVDKIKTITITSCVPDEGKTTTAINLAISTANAGMKTLLVNTDLRRPTAEKFFNIDNSLGITNYITTEINLEDIIYETNIENFYLTPCGTIPPNPSELLGTEKCSEFIETVKSKYFNIIKGQFDMVIFDTPPLGSVIDAAILSAQTDGVLLVIRSKSVNYKLAQEVKGQLEKANANLIGIVLNRIKKKDLQYGYKYYNYYYFGDKIDENSNPFKRLAKKLKLTS